ncbi:MAG: translesion error-prone DNA polymerase V subunit UmuC [Planctomycetaceae bacterium]
MNTFIGHVDADCYYVSAERVRHHCLRGIACGVLSNQGACVIAKSYELKAHGVTTAMPIWDAVPLCPDAVFIKRDFRWYEILSRKMLEVLQSASPRVEFYSIDEMFFDATGWGIDEARTLQERIIRDVGVPVSIGIAPTKTLAKLASDLGKPFGCFAATTEAERHRLIDGVPITEVTGIARRSAVKLARHGITTCDQLASAYPPAIRKLLTVKGEQLLLELRGESCYPISQKRAANKAIARGGTLGGATRDPAKVFGWAYRNTERLIEALDHHMQWAERVTLSISFREGGGLSRRASLPEATNDFHLIASAVVNLLDRFWPRDLQVEYMHVIADRLSQRSHRQRGLFVRRTDPRVAEVKKELNKKIGRFALRTAETLPLIDQYSDSTNDYDICDVYGKTCF